MLLPLLDLGREIRGFLLICLLNKLDTPSKLSEVQVDGVGEERGLTRIHMSTCIHVFMYSCMHVCMYVCIYMYIYTFSRQ